MLWASFWLDGKFGERQVVTREVQLGARIGGRTQKDLPFLAAPPKSGSSEASCWGTEGEC